jgi:hypothetical protein
LSQLKLFSLHQIDLCGFCTVVTPIPLKVPRMPLKEAIEHKGLIRKPLVRRCFGVRWIK